MSSAELYAAAYIWHTLDSEMHALSSMLKGLDSVRDKPTVSRACVVMNMFDPVFVDLSWCLPTSLFTTQHSLIHQL